MEESNEDIPKVLDFSQEGSSRRAPVPSIAAGAIIGKNGEAIGQMQKDTGAKIKLSKLNDFYPGTTERVCLIQGPLAGVRAMHNYIMDRILEKPEISAPPIPPGSHISLPSQIQPPGMHLSPTEPSSAPNLGGFPFWPINAAATGLPAQPLFPTNRLLWERHKQVKILVPNCTAGLVIGKQGSYVSEIKEATGAFIQISQKSKDINLPERCITIAGEADQLRAAVDMVLSKIAEDPQSGTCPTISYSHAQGPVASAYPTGSPFAYTTPQPIPQSPPAPAQTLINPRHPPATAMMRQKGDRGGGGTAIPPVAYFHNALQATYFAAAAAAAAAVDYQQRLVALNACLSHPTTHRGIESGEASGASSSLDSVGGGGGAGGGFVGPLTPPSEGGLGDTSSPSFYAASAPLLHSAATGQMLATATAPPLAALYPSPTGGLESPLDPSGFPILASSPPPNQPPKLFAPTQADAFFAAPLRASSPLSVVGPTPVVNTAAWLRSRGYSDDAVAEITHAMSTLSAHGVLNIGGTPPPPHPLSQPPVEPIMVPLGPPPIAHQQQQQQQQSPPSAQDSSGRKEGVESVEDNTTESKSAGT